MTNISRALLKAVHPMFFACVDQSGGGITGWGQWRQGCYLAFLKAKSA